MPGLRLVGTVYNYNDSRSRMKETCSVDLIPAIEFDGWLCDGRTDRPQWIPADIWADALQRHHLVPKIHCSGICILLWLYMKNDTIRVV